MSGQFQLAAGGQMLLAAHTQSTGPAIPRGRAPYAAAMSPTYHLAQVNVAQLAAPLDSPQLADFVAALDPINALADDAPGFVWRLQTEDGDATAIRAFPDDRIIVNLSVWGSVEALADFVYRSDHAGVMRRRREWFEPMAVYVTLWWVAGGSRPDGRRGEGAARAPGGARADAVRVHVPRAVRVAGCGRAVAAARRRPLRRLT